MSVTRTRRMRGLLLSFLAGEKIRGDGMPRQTAIDILARLLASAQMEASPPEVATELAYLKGKGYVEVERIPAETSRLLGSAAPLMGARITSIGRDVVDGTTKDPGVDMGEFAD